MARPGHDDYRQGDGGRRGKGYSSLPTSLKQAQAGRFGAVHTTEHIAARKRGRPVGMVKENAKAPMAMRVGAEVLDAIKASGMGWQTRVNAVLREAVQQGKLAA